MKIINFQSLGDERGELVSLEGLGNIPFEIKRVYYIYGIQEGISRGFHAHKKLKQVVVAVNGRCRFLIDDGKNRTSIILDLPTQGLFIDSCIWREMHDFSADCVLMVLASEVYDEDDYIRSYEKFITYQGKKYG